MRCLISECSHKQSRRGRINPHTNSWGRYGICPCCCNELVEMQVLEDRIGPSACRNELKNELEITPKKINSNPKKPKYKNRFQRQFVKYNGPPMPNELI